MAGGVASGIFSPFKRLCYRIDLKSRRKQGIEWEEVVSRSARTGRNGKLVAFARVTTRKGECDGRVRV